MGLIYIRTIHRVLSVRGSFLFFKGACVFCQKLRLHALSVDRSLLVRLRCKMWGCSYCTSINRKMWQVHLKKKLPPLGNAWSMVTVTARAKNHRFGTTLEVIIANWDKLLKRLKRAWGNFQYVRVYERHKSGEFHAHMLISFLPNDSHDDNVYRFVRGSRRYRGHAHKTLKFASWGAGLGFIVDFSPILHTGIDDKNHQLNRVVSYVTKYMTKNLQDMPLGTRRVQTSRLIGSVKTESDNQDTWLARHFIYEGDIEVLGKIEDVSRKYTVTFDDFDKKEVYPTDDENY